MKFIYSMFCILVISTSSVTAKDLKNDITIVEVTPELYCIVHAYPWPANSLAAVMENGDILLVDTPYTPEATVSVLSWIEKKFGKRIIKAVNTHFHVDRLGGNEALIKRNIPIYSSELTPIAIQNRGDSSLKLTASLAKDESIKKYYFDFKYVPPTEIFPSKEGLTLQFGKEIAVIKFIGAGHSIDNLFVFLPGKKAIFGGCAILSLEAKSQGNTSDGNVEEWIKVINSIDTSGYKYIIPGHGRIGGVELFAHTKKILEK